RQQVTSWAGKSLPGLGSRFLGWEVTSCAGKSLPGLGSHFLRWEVTSRAGKSLPRTGIAFPGPEQRRLAWSSRADPMCMGALALFFARGFFLFVVRDDREVFRRAFLLLFHQFPGLLGLFLDLLFRRVLAALDDVDVALAVTLAAAPIEIGGHVEVVVVRALLAVRMFAPQALPLLAEQGILVGVVLARGRRVGAGFADLLALFFRQVEL